MEKIKRKKRRKLLPPKKDLYIDINLDQKTGEGYVDVEVGSVVTWMELLIIGAVNDYLGYREGHENYENARHWLFVEDADDVMAMNNVCHILRLNKGKVRFCVDQSRDRGKTRYYKKEFDRFLDACT